MGNKNKSTFPKFLALPVVSIGRCEAILGNIDSGELGLNETVPARFIQKPAPDVSEDKQLIYRDYLAQFRLTVSTSPRKDMLPSHVAIVPTAASGGGDIRCALDIALILKQRGIDSVSVIILEGASTGRNDALIQKIQESPQFSGIFVQKMTQLTADFTVPEIVLAGPGNNLSTEKRINDGFSAICQRNPSPSFDIIRMEEPGFISRDKFYYPNPENMLGIGLYNFEFGLPVRQEYFRPMADIFSQNPSRLNNLKNAWLKAQLIENLSVETYADHKILSLIYHHIDYVFERSVYLLASATRLDTRDIDIVAKVWDPKKSMEQVPWTLVRSFEPDSRSILGMLNIEVLHALGVKQVEWVRPGEVPQGLTVASTGKTIRILDPFPMNTDDMDVIRDAAIPLQGVSGLMSVSRNIELNKIPLLEVLPDNREFYRELLSLARQVDPDDIGFARYLSVANSMMDSRPFSMLYEWSPPDAKYVPTVKSKSEVDLSEKLIHKERKINRYQEINGIRSELSVPLETVIEMGDILRSDGLKQQVEAFNRFIVTDCCLYDNIEKTLVRKMAAKAPTIVESRGTCAIN